MKLLNFNASFKLIMTMILLLAALIVNVFLLFSNVKKEGSMELGRLDMLSAGRQLMEASDMLTAEVRSFIMTGDPTHFKKYWYEVDVSKNRDKAIDTLQRLSANEKEILLLTRSKQKSDKLVQTELRSMRLIFDAYGVPNSVMPAVVRGFQLSSLDKLLSKEAKVLAAQKILFDSHYFAEKDKIHSLIDEFEKQLKQRTLLQLQKAQTKTEIYLMITMALSLLLLLVAVIALFSNGTDLDGP